MSALATAGGRRRGKSRLGWNLVGLLVFVTAGFPVYWMLNTAFKPAKDAIDPDPSLLPTGITLSNFSRALDIADFWGPVGRSLIVSLSVVVIGIVVGTLAALAISRFAFRGRKIVIVGILAVQMVPLVAMIIPVFLLLNDLDQYDKLSGLIITYLTFILPFTVWTLRGFIVNIPKELEEAAMVDGCSPPVPSCAWSSRCWPPAWSPPRSTPSSRPGTNTSTPSCCSARRTRPRPSGSATSAPRTAPNTPR